MSNDDKDSVRLDKWLWAVRLFKTRGLATEACKAGNIKIGGKAVKPGRLVRVGETLSVRTHALTKTVKVLAVLENRIGAKLVQDFMEDLTPAAEYERLKQKRENSIWKDAETNARPTKKDRRALDKFNE